MLLKILTTTSLIANSFVVAQVANANTTTHQLDNLIAQNIHYYQSKNSIKISNKEESKYTGIVKKVDDIAEKITVRIDTVGTESNGSGVIVAKQENRYYVLTAKHVLCNVVGIDECEANGTHKVVTPDGSFHQIDYQTVDANQAWLDIAIFSFESDTDYAVATIGNYDLDDDWIFVSGFPQKNLGSDGNFKRLITGGRLLKPDLEDLSIKDSSSLPESKESSKDNLVYTNISYRGMSGGAVLDTEGRLIGINTGAEQEIDGDRENASYELFNLGFSLGESVTDFLDYISQNKAKLKPNLLDIDSAPTGGLQTAEIANIEKQLLFAKEPSDRNSLVGWMNYGNQLWRYGRYKEAIEAFKIVTTIDSQFDKAYYAMGLVYVEQSQWSQAAKVLEQATDINSRPYYYWRYLATSYRFLRQYEPALSSYNRAIKQNLKSTNENIELRDFSLYLELGDLQRENKRYQEAIASYTTAIKVNPSHPFAYVNRAISYKETQQYDKAIVDDNKAISLNPSNLLFNYNRALTYYFLKKYNKSIEDCNLVLTNNPRDDETYDLRATNYKELYQYQKALADYNQAISINAQGADYYFNRGLLQYEYQKYDLAIADYNRAIVIDPLHHNSYSNRGSVYLDLGNYDRAIADYQKVIDINPQDYAYYNRGVAFSRSEQYVRAIADFNQTISINPKYDDAYNERGLIYINLGEYDKAVADFNQTISISSEYEYAYNNRGLIYANLGQYSKAITDYNQAISINYEYDDAYNNRGNAHAKLGQHKKAIEDFTKLININSTYDNVYFSRGLIYAELKNYDNAIKDFTTAISLNINNPQLYDTRGFAYYNSGKYQKALADFNKAIELDNELILSYYYRGRIFDKSEEYDKSINDYSKAILLINKYKKEESYLSYLYLNRGIIRYQLEEYDNAIVDLDKASRFFLLEGNTSKSQQALTLIEIIKQAKISQ